MRKWILRTALTSIAGYAWKNRHRVLGKFSGDRTVSGPDRYEHASTAKATS